MPNCRSVRPRSRLMGSTIRPMMKRSSTENQYSSASTTVAYQPTAGRGYGVTPGGVAVMVPLIQTPPIRDCPEIGRASCRERVCQYVSISVVAVSLKKIYKLTEQTNTTITKNIYTLTQQ